MSKSINSQLLSMWKVISVTCTPFFFLFILIPRMINIHLDYVLEVYCISAPVKKGIIQVDPASIEL